VGGFVCWENGAHEPTPSVLYFCQPRVADDRRLPWGKSWSHHETKTATIGETVKNSHFRFHWDSEEDRNTFVELRIERGELTNDHILIITDHAEIEDVDFLEGFWEDNLDRLHRTCGL